jgi:hypothetical protein
MRVAITRSPGLIRSALTHALLTDGHQVVRLVHDRSARLAEDGSETAQWDPIDGRVPPGVLDTVDAGVRLAGSGIGDTRRSAAYKEEIRRNHALGPDHRAGLRRIVDPHPVSFSPCPRPVTSATPATGPSRSAPPWDDSWPPSASTGSPPRTRPGMRGSG